MNRIITYLFGRRHVCYINALNAKLNPICHLLALLGAHHILHISRIRVKPTISNISQESHFKEVTSYVSLVLILQITFLQKKFCFRIINDDNC